MVSFSEFAPVLHVTGFLVAIAIYGMLIAMALGARKAGSVSLFPLLAGVLGLVWNLGSLARFGLPELGFPDLPQAVDAVAYAALGFLPAVVVHSILREQSRPAARAVTLAAYGVSATAGIAHFVHVARAGFAPMPEAIHALGPVYGVLLVPLVFLTAGEPVWRRALWMAALALFALSGTELAYHAEGSIALDLVGHHASMLLAFVILYQEYRFALADRFLKRALGLVVLVALALTSYGLVLSPAVPDRARSFVLVALWVLTALGYPWLQRGLDRLVDRWVLQRDGYGALRSELGEAMDSAETSTEVMERLEARLARALNAAGSGWEHQEDSADPHVSFGAHAESAAVVVPTAEPPRYRLVFSRLSEGRRLLDEDARLLEWVAVRAARRIDRLRLVHERYEHELRRQEVEKLATEAELKALRAQLNPHFLFNALTTLGHLIQTAPPRAMETLLTLTDLLRRVLRSSTELTTLDEELSLVTAYLDIERARFEERLEVAFEVPKALRSLKVPPLILQPLVENAVKHGIARTRGGGR